MPTRTLLGARLSFGAVLTLSCLAAALILPLCASTVPPVVFRTPPTFAVGDGPWQVVSADFNRDGIADLATVDFDVNTVSVLLGLGGGIYGTLTEFVVGNHPDSLTVADVNGDGNIDIVTANGEGWSGPGTVSVLLGRGDGTFETVRTFTTAQGPKGVVVADFNGDGNADIATAISGGWRATNQVNVLFGHGNGSFDPPATYTVGWVPSWIAAGDFNGDGHPDLVTADNGGGSMGTTISVLLNKGDGTFWPATNYTVGSYPSCVLVADFNKDNKLDIAVADSYGAGPAVSLLLGRGDGTFNPASTFPCPAGASQLAAGDFNSDGKLDLAALGGGYDSGAVSLFLGDGVGSFAAPVTFNIGVGLQGICSADLTGDGRLDLAVSAGYDNTVLLMPGNGDGTFKSVTDTYAVGGSINGMITGDFNRDDQLDLVTVNYSANSVSVLLQQTNGSFLPAVNYTVGSQPHSVKAGDFNNDGWTDLVVANFDGTLTMLRGRTTAPGVFTNNWNNGFLGTVTIGGSHRDVAVGYFNSGMHLDIVTPNYYDASLSVALGDSTGAFHTPYPPVIPVNSGPTCVIVDDFNGDGMADIAVGYDGGFKISIATGNGDGTFNPKADINTWEIPWWITSADVNGDGKPDLIAAHYDWRRISVMINLTTNGGPITFAPPIMHDVANDPVCVTVADFNGDNVLDIASGNYASVSVMLGNSDGTFNTATNYWVGGARVAAGDFNKDGMPDLAMDLGSRVGLFWNDTLPRLQISMVGGAARSKTAGSGGVRVAYPAWKPYQLQVSTNLTDDASWLTLSNSPATLGSQYVITNTITGGNQTYRLRRP